MDQFVYLENSDF